MEQKNTFFACLFGNINYLYLSLHPVSKLNALIFNRFSEKERVKAR